nr:hypothetical protein GCM10025730_00960 [Promicromonospora thailandica]
MTIAKIPTPKDATPAQEACLPVVDLSVDEVVLLMCFPFVAWSSVTPSGRAVPDGPSGTLGRAARCGQGPVVPGV